MTWKEEYVSVKPTDIERINKQTRLLLANMKLYTWVLKHTTCV
jgi:hypothetical protein